jgi:hypothetical protein
MLGIFKAPDGTAWITSNEDFRQVSPSNAKAGVTQADLDANVRQMTGELYRTQDLRGFRFCRPRVIGRSTRSATRPRWA